MASPKLDWSVALAGECMVCRPFAMHDDEASMAVINLLREADLTYAHLEMNFAEWSELKDSRDRQPSYHSRMIQKKCG